MLVSVMIFEPSQGGVRGALGDGVRVGVMDTPFLLLHSRHFSEPRRFMAEGKG